MRLKLAVKGDLVAAMADYEEKLAVAVTEGLDETLDRAHRDYRQQVEQAGLGTKIPRTIRKQRYPKSKPSIGASGIIWTRAPEIIDAFNSGSAIVPGHGRFLAIPTQWNRKGGRRKAAKEATWTNVRVTPEEMIRSGADFVIPNKGGPGKLWMLTISHAQARKGKKNKIHDLAYAGGLALLGGGRVGRTRDILKHEAVPMYTLLPNVKLKKRLDIARIRSDASRRLPRAMKYKIAAIGEGA
jgi:hypothetical protein